MRSMTVNMKKYVPDIVVMEQNYYHERLKALKWHLFLLTH